MERHVGRVMDCLVGWHHVNVGVVGVAGVVVAVEVWGSEDEVYRRMCCPVWKRQPMGFSLTS